MHDKEFKKIINELKRDKNILAIILTGSRGKGFENKYSDYDLIIITKNDSYSEVKKLYKEYISKDLDLMFHSLSGFQQYAMSGTAYEWDRYTFAHVKIIYSKIKNLKKLIHDKGYLQNNQKRKFIEQSLDGYINGVYRFAKCFRNKNKIGAHLEAVNSVLDLLTLVFAMNQRYRPFLTYVEQELINYPLKELPWSNKYLLKKVKLILKSGNLKTQRELFKDIKSWCVKEGYVHIFKAWKGKDELIMKL